MLKSLSLRVKRYSVNFFFNYKNKFKLIKVICHKNKSLRHFINLLTVHVSQEKYDL